jgi:hypothetical protein
MIPRRRFLASCAAIAGLGLVYSCSMGPKMKKTSNQRFRFIFCNDIHFGFGDDARLMSNVIEEWRTGVPLWDFVVCAGDLTCNGSDGELKSVRKYLEELKKPFYPLVGNHDLTGPQAGGWANYEAVFGKNRDNYLVVHKGVAMIFLDLTNGNEVDSEVPQRTLEFLKQTLDGLSVLMPVIVFTHFPLHPDTPRFAVKNADAVFGLLDTRNVMAYFSGHFHGRWHGERKGVPFFCNARLLPNVQNHDASQETGFCIVDVSDSSVEVVYRNVGNS